MVYGELVRHAGQFQSTHPVRGATSMAVISAATVSRFQSTHPVRGATAFARLSSLLSVNFNPRTP